MRGELPIFSTPNVWNILHSIGCQRVMTSTSEYLEHGLSTHMASKLPELAPLGFLSYVAPPDVIRLEQAENRLLRPQLLSICKDALNEGLSEDVQKFLQTLLSTLMLTYPRVSSTLQVLAAKQQCEEDSLHSSIHISTLH